MSRSSVPTGDDSGDDPRGPRGPRPGPSVDAADRRGQFEAVAALIAVAAVCTGLTLYTGVLADAVPESDRNVAEPTLREVEDRIRAGGLVRPSRLDASQLPDPDGYLVNVTVTATGVDRRWAAGPALPADVAGRLPDVRTTAPRDPPSDARYDVATGRAGVRVAPAAVQPGRIRVVVWR